MSRKMRHHGNDNGSLLGAVFIIAMGVGCCLCTVAAMDSASLPFAGAIVGGIATLLTIWVVAQRFGRTPSSSLGFWNAVNRNQRNDGVAAEYEPRKAGGGSTAGAGSNQPISVEEVRDIKVTSANTWVPSRDRNRQRD